MKKTAIIFGCVCFLAISAVVLGQGPVIISPGQSVTVSCGDGVELQSSAHEDHFAWHRTSAKQNGVDSCKTCHGDDLRGIRRSASHGIRVFPARDAVVDAVGCYPNPWLALGVPDPFGDTGEYICNQTGDRVAVYQAGTEIGCYQCHKKVMGIELR
jgi:hypothetical protein